MSLKLPIEDSWIELLEEEFNKSYFRELWDFIVNDQSQSVIYPPENQIYAAFQHTSFHKVKVVLLGQDPYHGPAQAHGLCFSVPEGIVPPPSLVNIFKELKEDTGIPVPTHGNLTKWAQQGVLLLNTTLTVRANHAGSHQKKGWEVFTDRVIETLSKNGNPKVFLLWGNYAQQKSVLIDKKKHLVLKTVHPSPLSAYRGFFGCRHFSKTNEFLISHNLSPIDWNICT
jgi:uracil-DNA glycosylase